MEQLLHIKNKMNKKERGSHGDQKMEHLLIKNLGLLKHLLGNTLQDSRRWFNEWE
jgi:hypothetical protein